MKAELLLQKNQLLEEQLRQKNAELQKYSALADELLKLRMMLTRSVALVENSAEEKKRKREEEAEEKAKRNKMEEMRAAAEAVRHSEIINLLKTILEGQKLIVHHLATAHASLSQAQMTMPMGQPMSMPPSQAGQVPLSVRGGAPQQQPPPQTGATGPTPSQQAQAQGYPFFL
jgi:hypothetical protein